MVQHTYAGVISFPFTVESNKVLTVQEIIDGIAVMLTESGIPECDLGDIEHYIDGQLVEN